jgi:adenylate kinase
VGREAADYMQQGRLVPDDVIMKIMKERLQGPDCAGGFILDGFPRTIAQADALRKLLGELGITLDAVINLEVPETVLLRRLTSRRTCSQPSCQAIFNIHTMPPKKEGICDRCGSPLVQRDDETEAAIKVRLETYSEKTAPLIKYYSKEDVFFTVPGLEARTVFNDIMKKLSVL